MDNKSFNNDIHLTYEELVAYGQGNLSNKEMHRLELHLINCELCNEALDGIANIDETVLYKNLANIRAKTEIKSSISISISRKQWMAMAASVALIAVVSIIFILLPDRQETTIAENSPVAEEPQLVEDFGSKNMVVEDSLSIITRREDSLLALADVPPPQYAARKVQAEDVIEEEAKGLGVSDLAIDDIEIATANDSAFLTDNISQEITADEIIAEEDNEAARSKKMAAPVAGAESPVAREAVTTKSKLETSTSYKAAEPEKGIKSYNRYLKRSLKYPYAARESKIEGNVVLELTINTFGSITNINVVQSLGYGCDQEALRLVKDGPSWLPGSSNNTVIVDTVRVSIPFKL